MTQTTPSEVRTSGTLRSADNRRFCTHLQVFMLQLQCARCSVAVDDFVWTRCVSGSLRSTSCLSTWRFISSRHIWL